VTLTPEFWLFATQVAVTAIGAAVTIGTLLIKNRKAAESVAEKVVVAAKEHTDAIDAQTAEIKGDVGEVKRIVNGERAALVERIAALEAAKAHLEAALQQRAPAGQ
jgi:predicted chitinase